MGGDSDELAVTSREQELRELFEMHAGDDVVNSRHSIACLFRDMLRNRHESRIQFTNFFLVPVEIHTPIYDVVLCASESGEMPYGVNFREDLLEFESSIDPEGVLYQQHKTYNFFLNLAAALSKRHLIEKGKKDNGKKWKKIIVEILAPLYPDGLPESATASVKEIWAQLFGKMNDAE